MGYVVFIMMLVSSVAHAQSANGADAVTAVNQFSSQLITLLKGPIAKIVSAIVLLGGVAALLRGRNHVAIACAAAFIVLLFLPMLIGFVGG